MGKVIKVSDEVGGALEKLAEEKGLSLAGTIKYLIEHADLGGRFDKVASYLDRQMRELKEMKELREYLDGKFADIEADHLITQMGKGLGAGRKEAKKVAWPDFKHILLEFEPISWSCKEAEHYFEESDDMDMRAYYSDGITIFSENPYCDWVNITPELKEWAEKEGISL